MARSHKQKKPVARREPDPKLLEDNDARIAEAKALASTEAPARNNDGTFAKMKAVVMPQPPQAGQPALAPRSSGRRKAAAKAVVPVAAVALPQPYDHPLNQKGSGAQVLEVTEFVVKVTPEQQPGKSSLDESHVTVPRQKRRKRKQHGLPLFIALVLFVAFSVLGYAIYIDFTSVP